MIIEKCDKCGSEIKDKVTRYYLQLEEWDHNGWHSENATSAKRAAICLDCYKNLLNDLYK